MYHKIFQLGEGQITAQTYYKEETGFGFVDPLHIPGKTHSEQSLYLGGWNLRASAVKDVGSFAHTTSDGVETGNERAVLVFKADVKQDGSYQVLINITSGDDPIHNMKLFCGRRNLIARNIELPAHSSKVISFITYVSPYIPAMTSIPMEEKAIYISYTGHHASISQITITETNAPVLYIAGDSTLTDQNALYPYYPYGSCGGWAQMLAQYFPTVAICNQAHSGMTTNCFRDDGHWDIILKHIRPGDIVMLQFGHNDQKRRNLAAFGGYINNLRRYISEIRSVGAYPVVISPISRIPFEDNGKFRSLLSTHALACQAVADECNVPFIDLHSLTLEKWIDLGEPDVHDYFMDITHTNDYGANLIASYVVSEIQRQNIAPLASCPVNPVSDTFTPDQDTKEVPSESTSGGTFDMDIPYVDIAGIPQYNNMVEALRLGLLDPCVMHLHPTAVMPRAQFLMVFFKALRLSGKRPYLGQFSDLSRYEWDSSYVQACIDENLIDPDTVSETHFRPDDALTAAEYASFLIRGCHNVTERNISLKECYSDAVAKGFLPDYYAPDAAITRADCYQGLVILMKYLHSTEQALPSDAELHPVG